MAAVKDYYEILGADFPSQFLETIIDIWKNKGTDGSQSSFSLAMEQGLRLSGIPHRGHEVVQIHTCLLDVLLQIRSGAKGESFSAVKDSVTWREYFQLLADTKLRWAELVRPMLPLMPVSIACHYLKNLVQYLETSMHKASEVSDGEICLCITGIDLGLNTLLDLLLRSGCQENEDIGAALGEDLQTFMMHTKSCLDCLLYMVELKSGLEACLTSTNTFKAVTQSLLLTLFITCPILPLEVTASQLKKYDIRHQGRLSNGELSAKDKPTPKLQENSKTQRGEGVRTEKDDWFPDSSCTQIEINRNYSTTTSRSKAENLVLNESMQNSHEQPTASESRSENKNSIEHLCHKVFSYFKLECISSLFEKIVCFFCPGSYANNSRFFTALTNVASNQEHICIGRHQFSHLILQEQFLPLLWYLTSQEDKSYPVGCDLPRVQDTLSLLDKYWQSGESCSQTREIVAHLKQRVLPDQLLCLHLSEAERILAKGHSLSGDLDLALLGRLVDTKDRGWRELMSLGMKSKDFLGWWSNGFFKLLWATEASLATENNVKQVIQSLRSAAHSHKMGSCNKIVVNDMKKLVSVMFQRLPTSLKEQVVLSFIKNSFSDPSHYGELACDQQLSEVMPEGQVINELTFILNRLTLENAEQQSSFLLYLCLYHPRTVIRHLVRAAISTNVQTAPVVKVLRNMSLISRHSEEKDTNCLLVNCIEEEICNLEFDNDKQVQVVADFLSLITEPSTKKIEDGTTTMEIKSEGVLSLSNVLHSFVFPCLSSKKTSPFYVETDKPAENTEKALESTGHSLEIALSTLEIFLEIAANDQAFTVSEFQPLQLMISVCDCYSQNYLLLVKNHGSSLLVCPQRKTARLASHRCFTLLVQLVKSAWESLPESDKAWLYNRVSERSWLCTALLAPVLILFDGRKDIFDVALTELVAAEELSTRKLVYLFQMAGVNSRMSETICDKVSMLTVHLHYDNLLVALKWVLWTAVTDEMARMIQVLKHLLRVCDTRQQQTADVRSFNLLEVKESILCVRLCQTLVDSAVLVVTDKTNESLTYHSLSNYQPALQNVLCQMNQTELPVILVNILCQHCSLLALTRGQAAEILQVTALDILSRLKTAVADRKKQKRSGSSGGAKVGSLMQENRELEELLSSVFAWLACVEDAEISLVLSNQLREVTT